MTPCYNNDTELALKLIKKNANLDLQNEDGWTALIWACDNNNTEIASYMLEYIKELI